MQELYAFVCNKKLYLKNISGWPQITGIHVKPFMGIEPTNQRIYMRDCDWWRCKDNKIIENWCMVDTLHLVHQLGRDVLSEISI